MHVLYHIDRQRLCAVADGYLMAWIRCEVEPCTHGDLFREHHLAVVFLREPLQPTGNVDGIPTAVR